MNNLKLKSLSIKILIATLIASGMQFGPTSIAQAAPATLDTIAITTPATKTTYVVGETLDITGMVVTGTYSDATTEVLTVTAGDVSGFDSSAAATGQVLTVTISGVSTTYTVDIVATSPVLSIVITGTKKVGSTLTADTSGTTGAPSPTFTYEWQSSPNGVDTFTAISGATSSTYSLTSSDEGTYFVVVVTAVNAAGNDVETSTVTSVINPADPAPAPPAPAPLSPSMKSQDALSLSAKALTVQWGSSTKLSVSGGSGTGAITYSSEGSTFCPVDATGYLIPVHAGVCRITATKASDGTYAPATSNTIEITATEPPAPTANCGCLNTDLTLAIGAPVKGFTAISFKVNNTYNGKKVSVILATKNSKGKTLYRTLGTAKVDATGAVKYKTKVPLPVGAVLQLKSAGEVIFSKSIK